MKVKTFVQIEQEVEVDVTMDDIRAAMVDEIGTVSAALQLVNRCATSLKAVSDDMIGEMNNAQRELVANFMREQANRYMPNVMRERTRTRGAGGAYAAPVPRVKRTLHAFVGALHSSSVCWMRIKQDPEESVGG
jgi:hypothetical protein